MPKSLDLVTATAPEAPGAAQRMGAHAARGALWAMLFSLLSKGLALGSQFALAWFVLPEEFGLAAMTLSIMSFTAVAGAGNLKNILIQQPARFATEVGSVFWFSFALNGCAALCLAAFAPLAGAFLNDSRIVPLILVGAVAQVCQSLCTIHLAALHRDFRFKRIAMIQWVASALQNGGAMILAWIGLGAAALVLPLIGVALWNVAAHRSSTGKIRVGKPEPGRWRALGLSASWLMLNGMFTALVVSGATFVIGLMRQDAAVAGYYYWGFSLASQAVFLLGANLQGVLFPVLNKLNVEPARQFLAVDKCGRTLLTMIAPVCVLQFLLAEPVITLLFPRHWEPSIAVVKWISLGLVSQPLYLVAVVVLMARGRFRRLAAMTGLVAGTTLAAAAAGAVLGNQAQVAQFVGLSLLVANTLAGWLAYREFGKDWRHLWGSIVPIFGIAGLMAISGWGLSHVLSRFGAVGQISTMSLLCLAVYAALVKCFAPQVAADVILRLRWSRETRSATAPPPARGLREVQP